MSFGNFIMATNTAPIPVKDRKKMNNSNFVKLMKIMETLSRSFNNSIKTGLENVGVFDINSHQAMIVYNIGSEKVTVGDVIKNGYYQGQNPTYSIKKLINKGYLVKDKNEFDARSCFVYLTDKGFSLMKVVEEVILSQEERLNIPDIDVVDRSLYTILYKFENTY